MPAATRSKRAASPPAADADQAPARKTRAKANNAKPADTSSADNGQDNGQTTADVKKRPPKNSKAKVKSEPSQEEQLDVPEHNDEKPESKSEIKDAQVAKAGTSQIPLDEECILTGHHVYIDPDQGLIYDASLNQTNASGNNNKFYRIQVSCDARRMFQRLMLTICPSCSSAGPNTRHGLAGAASARGASMLFSETAAWMML